MRCRRDSDHCRPGSTRQLVLFSACEITAPTPSLNGLPAKIANYLQAFGKQTDRPLRLVLVSDAQTVVTFPDRQLPLPLELPRRPSLARIVPAIRRAFLDYGVYEQFRDEPESFDAALQLEKSGIYMLGQLIQMSEDQLRAYSFINDRVLQSMKANLARFDLGLDTRHPPWNRRMKSIAAVNL
jgi:hypothetical protein